MTENQKKLWKLALVVVPVVLAQIGSYAKARAESMDESKAGYELMKENLETVQGNIEALQQTVNEQNNHIYVLEGQLTALKDVLAKTRSRVAKIHPVDAGVDGDGVPAAAVALPNPTPLRLQSAPRLPARFEDVVQKYKAMN